MYKKKGKKRTSRQRQKKETNEKIRDQSPIPKVTPPAKSNINYYQKHQFHKLLRIIIVLWLLCPPRNHLYRGSIYQCKMTKNIKTHHKNIKITGTLIDQQYQYSRPENIMTDNEGEPKTATRLHKYPKQPISIIATKRKKAITSSGGKESLSSK